MTSLACISRVVALPEGQHELRRRYFQHRAAVGSAPLMAPDRLPRPLPAGSWCWMRTSEPSIFRIGPMRSHVSHTTQRLLPLLVANLSSNDQPAPREAPLIHCMENWGSVVLASWAWWPSCWCHKTFSCQRVCRVRYKSPPHPSPPT